MKIKILSLICLSVLFFTNISNAQVPNQPILETYTISHGGNQGGPSAGLDVELSDDALGNGNTNVLLSFSTEENSSTLALRVWRKVKRGEITFALLLDHVEVRGYDAGGQLIFSRDLPGFVFGDSKSGRWAQRLRDLPAGIYKLQVTFVGNYE